MTGIAEYDAKDGLGLAELVRDKSVSAGELVEEGLRRIDRVDPQINAIVRTLPDLARKRATGELSGPFAGVPFLVKDLLQCIPGVPTENGSHFWKGWTVDAASNLYRRWLATGAIPIGKTTTPEVGLLPVTETAAQGDTRNPWDLGRTPGGSSGGSGSAVAAGIVPFASGGDGGGSIRIPSSCCGLFGMKPSRGRMPTGPFLSEAWSGFAQEHVLTRSVRDSAAMMDATHGYDPASAYAAPPPPTDGSFLDAANRDPKPLRIALHWTPPMPCDVVDPSCIAAVKDAAALCESLGHHVEEWTPGHNSEELGRAFLIMLGGNLEAEIRNGERVRGRKATADDYELSTRVTALLGNAFSAAEFVQAEWVLQAEQRRVANHLDKYDVVLTPTLALPPVKMGELKPTGAQAVLQRIAVAAQLRRALRIDRLVNDAAKDVFGFTPFTPLANFCGFPSMSVPLHWNSDGLPIGSMFTAGFAREDLLYSLGGQLERARPWFAKRAPVHASNA